MYPCEVWAGAYESKYLEEVNKFCRRTQKYGYTNKFKTISEIIKKMTCNFVEKVIFYQQSLHE